jgi:hypothetical protein
MPRGGAVMLLAFQVFLAIHIVAGATGIIAFWVPVLGRKGSPNHRRWGRVFNRCMLAVGCAAIGLSTATLIDPLGTHPHLAGHPDFRDPALIRAVFGWMMLYLAILTINLTWYGWLAVRNGRRHHLNREWRNRALQWLVLAAAVNCAVQAWLAGIPLLAGMAVIGFATVGTNWHFLRQDDPGPTLWLREHIKALVGAGISVYTAFFAFGAVRVAPFLALNPLLWAIPLVVGLTLIVVHRRRVLRQHAASRSAVPAAS